MTAKATTTPEVPHVFAAIQMVQERFSRDGLAKDNVNKTQNFKFRGIDDVYNSLSTYLVEAKLLLIPRVVSRETSERTSKGGGMLIYTNVTVEYDLISSVDGSRVTGCVVGEAMDSGDKSSNKAMSAAYKYMCLQTFCIPTEGDNDADATTHVLAPKVNDAPAQSQPPKRDTGAVLSVAQHAALIRGSRSLKELRAAFGKAWKHYENPKDPADVTDNQEKLRVVYDERKFELEGSASDGGADIGDDA